MKIRVISFFYNEEFLTPFFLSHYKWADEIYAIYSISPDRTMDELIKGKNVTVDAYDFPNGIDDLRKQAKLNAVIKQSDKFDWVICVDADEFVWPAMPNISVHNYLDTVRNGCNVVWVRMHNVFRHVTDKDLNPLDEPVHMQRRHGIVELNHPENTQYHKPCILRPDGKVILDVGAHRVFEGYPTYSNLEFRGAHWKNADSCFSVDRIIRGRRDRLSATNKGHGFGKELFGISEQDILNVCKQHENDHLCF